MIDTILSCPQGYNIALAEAHAKGFDHILHIVDGAVVGIAKEFNPLYPSHDDFNESSLVYLRADDDLLNPLLAETWETFKILGSCQAGESLLDLIKADQEAFVEYTSYPATQVPEFDSEGNPNIMYPEFNNIDVEGVPTQVKNPHYQSCLALGNFE